MESWPGNSSVVVDERPPNLTNPADTPANATTPTPSLAKKLRRLSPPDFEVSFLFGTTNSVYLFAG